MSWLPMTQRQAERHRGADRQREQEGARGEEGGEVSLRFHDGDDVM